MKSQTLFLIQIQLLFLGLLIIILVKPNTEIPDGVPCQVIPNFCDRVYCAPPENCDEGIIVKGAGNCGCCESCITYRDVGDNCTGAETNEPAVLPNGVLTQNYESPLCQPGLVCNKGKCDYPTDGKTKDCTYHENECKENSWEAKPNCDFYGNYDDKTCKGNSNPRCFCVNKNGETIFGRLPTGTENATCACSRAVDDNSGKPISNFIFCDETGDFKPMQCWGEICFCVDPYTKLMTSPAVPIAGIKALPCWDSKLYVATYYNACTTEYLKVSALVEEFMIKGMNIQPLDLPLCDPDMTYGVKQFQDNQYFCSDKEGAQIGSYYTQDYSEYSKMICNCARDVKYPTGLPDDQRGRKCDSRGNYVLKYCTQNICYCLDTDGQQSSNTFSSDSNCTCDSPATCPPPSTLGNIRTVNLWTGQKP